MRNREEFKNKLIIFDMEHTLLQNRFIDLCAERFKFQQALALLRQIDTDTVSLTRRTAWFLRDQKKSVLMEIAADMPLVPGITEAVQQLKEKDYTVGIISDSYQFVTAIVSRKIGVDFELSNELQFLGNHVTGEVVIPSYFYRTPHSTCSHNVCKTNALHHICKAHQTKLENCIVVGGADEDACMLGQAGLGVAFSNSTEMAKSAAARQVEKPSFTEILSIVP